MLIFDQLKKSEPQLRVVTLIVLGGLGVLLAGLWWVQIVSSRGYLESLETQSFRTVRIPAVRGKILDRNGAVMVENRPTYNVSLYLEELRGEFAKDYARTRPVRVLTNSLPFWQRWLGFDAVKTQYVKLRKDQLQALTWESRDRVASNVVFQLSQRLRQPVNWDPALFEQHYQKSLALPFPVLRNLDSTNIARFEEQTTSPLGVDLEVQSSRSYPYGTMAAHLLGYLKHDDSSVEGEESYYSYRLPDYKGQVGIEAGFDKELRGTAGAKSVLVNNVGYRQTENIWSPAEPGHNVTLTIDLRVQQAAEHALQHAPVLYPAPVRGAVVVMDVTNGDILAMASSPTFDPNSFVPRISREEYQRLSALHAEKNRATFENYMPGSIFKTVVGLAALEAGWNPNRVIVAAPNPHQPDKAGYPLGNRVIRDTAVPGEYNFSKALKLSCNTYFVTVGLWTGPEKILRLAQHLHFGERSDLPTRQDAPGQFPSLRSLSAGWSDGNTANISIGADPVWITPVQAAVLTSAIANRGKVLWPRLVERIEPQDPTSGEPIEEFPPRPPRDELGVSKRSMDILHVAMLADTEDPDGTGRHVRDNDHPLTGLRICAKTGTAEVQDEHNRKTGKTTWFASFAPYENPRWAVVVMVEDGIAGGTTCSPVAGEVYKALLVSQQADSNRPNTLARSDAR